MRAGAKRFVGRLTWLCLILSLTPAVGRPQATVRVSAGGENFLKDPNGRRLATVSQGVELPLLAQRSGWVQVELQGWIWSASVAATSRDGFDLIVSADGGENLRAAPQAKIVARLLEGFLIDRVAANGNWVQVRRQGWLREGSVEINGAAPAAGGSAGSDGSGATSDSGAPISVLIAGNSLVVYATPDGDTVASFEPGAQAQILGRTGDWIRVRVDGWVYGPAALDSAIDLADTGDLTPAQLRADPSRYKGTLVRWQVQFISLRRAERARTDFEEGEPFLLARGPPGDAGFVYLAVPDGLLAVSEELEPLEYLTIVGRVRTGRSQLLGSPVVDLTDIERIADR